MGPNLGGALYQKIGLIEAYPTNDKGRSEIRGNQTEEYYFMVPALRNVSETGPYLHDGSVASLEEVVKLMARHQLGRTLTDEQVADLVVFLEKLTGRLPADYIAEPKLPGMS